MLVESGGVVPSSRGGPADDSPDVEVEFGRGCLVEAALGRHPDETASAAYEHLVAEAIVAGGDYIACRCGCGGALSSLQVDGQQVRGIVLEVALDEPRAASQCEVQ